MLVDLVGCLIFLCPMSATPEKPMSATPEKPMSATPEKLSRWHVLAIWALSSMAASALGSIGRILHWESTYVGSPGIDWSPIDELPGTLTMLPFGWCLSVLTPMGWLSLLGLGLMIRHRSVRPLWLSVLASLVFGVFWPPVWTALSGV